MDPLHEEVCTLMTVKAITIQVWTGPYGSRRLRLPEFVDSPHIKVIRLPALNASAA
jgi:hypothetical protein